MPTGSSTFVELPVFVFYLRRELPTTLEQLSDSVGKERTHAEV